MATRILLLTQWFDPEPTFKGLVFARELARQGFDVEVLTGFPNYPGGKLYSGYSLKWLQREVIDGVLITRVPLYPSHDQSAIRRVLNYVSFAASAVLYGLLGAKKPDVVYAYHPPLTVGIAAVFIRFFRRVPVVYDIQDMWPDTLRVTGMLTKPLFLTLIGKVCYWVYRHVDHIVVLSPGFKRLLAERGVADHKVDVIYNWCDEASLSSPSGVLATAFPPSDKFRILFAGNMGKAQALDAVLDAAKLLSSGFPQICFVLLGGGVELERLKKQTKEFELSNVNFLPAVPMSEVGSMLAEADALLVHLKKDPLFQITIPSKIQAYMAVGKPILMAVDGDAAELVREGKCGVVAESQNPESIAAAAIRLFESGASARKAMGVSGRNFYQQYLSLRVGVKRFADIFRRFSAL
jgi:glycosyltransferase involved in cell wall biosynthesis